MALLPRKSGEFVARIAKNVKVNQEGVQNVAKKIKACLADGSFSPDALYLHAYPHPTTATPHALEWIFVADLLNFSFWMPGGTHYTVTHKGVKYTGYMALTAALTRALEDGIPITSASYYATIERDVLQKVLSSDEGHPSIPLFDERLKSLNEAGQTLLEKFNGQFKNVLDEAKGSALELCRLVTENFPTFRDEAVYAGREVRIWKRVQILAADIWGLFHGKGLGQFRDVEEVTMFADYRVPQVLVYFGALEYSTELSEKLGQGADLPNGSEEEVEIRACSIHAVELLREELKKEGINMNSALIDFFLWDYRRKFAEEMTKIPFHRTRCIYY